MQELIDDFMKENLETWEQVTLLEFIATNPEWQDYLIIELMFFCYQKVNMLVFRKLVMHGKWKIRMHVFESESVFQVRGFGGLFKDGFSVIHSVAVSG